MMNLLDTHKIINSDSRVVFDEDGGFHIYNTAIEKYKDLHFYHDRVVFIAEDEYLTPEYAGFEITIDGTIRNLNPKEVIE